MGVKNFKYLLKSQQPQKINTFKYIIVDGNNLLITFLCSAKSKIAKSYTSTTWAGFSIDILKQTKLILNETLKLIFNELNRFVDKYQTEEIWIIFDPPKDFDYKINIDTFHLIDNDYFNSLPHDEHNNIILNVKDEEHKKRELSRNTTKERLQTTLTAIENNEYYKTLSETTNISLNDIQQLYKQSYGYEDSTILLKLLTVLQKALINKSRKTLELNFIDEREDFLNLNLNIDITAKLYTLYAKDEADLVIKNISKYLTNIHGENILIISKDTDYKILFANDENVYISDLHYDYSNKITHPFTLWRELLSFLPAERLYDYVIRLAPIFGNDYTNGKGIINLSATADNINYIKALLNLPYDKISANTSIYKFVKTLPQEKQLFTPTQLDYYIKQYDSEYYDKYIKSVVIYYNYNFFNDFEITTKYYDFDITLDYIIDCILLQNYESIYNFNNITDLKGTLINMTKTKDKEEIKRQFYNNSAITTDIPDIDDSYFD